MPLNAEDVLRTLEGTPDAVEGFKPSNDTPEPPTPPAPPTNTNEPPAQHEPVTPPADTPPANAPAAEQQSQFNFDNELGLRTNGLVKSNDELAALIEKANKFADLEGQFNALKTEVDTSKNANPFANDYTKKLNDLYQSGASQQQIDAFNTLNRVDIAALSPFQVSSLALQMKHGLTADQADTYLADKYKIDPEELAKGDFKLDPVDAVKLQIDSDADKQYLNAQKVAVSTPPSDTQEQERQLFEQQNAQRIEKITPIAKTIANEIINSAFKGFSINGQDGDKAVRIDLPITPEIAKNITEATERYIAQYDIQPNEKGQQSIRDFVNNSLWIANGQKWLIEAANQRELQVRAEYDNPSVKNPPRGEANPERGVTKEQARANAVAAALDLSLS